MRMFQVALLVLSIYFCPTLSSAQATFQDNIPALTSSNDVLFVQTHTCSLTPATDQDPGGAICHPRTYSKPGAKNINDAAAAMRADSTPVYTQTATDAGLKLRDERIAKLEMELNNHKASAPHLLGKEVEASIKGNMKDVLLLLMATDEQFRKEIAGILKSKQ